MASKDQVESWTEEVVCPICLDFFTDPVSLECGHYFCRSCITQRWDREERNSCPECGEEFTDRTLRVSRVVARLSAKARTLSLNRKVKGSIMPVKEAVETNKDPVKAIQSLTKNKSKTQQMEQQQKQKNSGVLRQSHNLQSQITSQFAELRQILAEKEQRVLADIPEEEKQILNRMEKYLQQIQENLNSIENKVKSLQEQLDLKDNVSFLKILTEKEQRILADIRGKVKKVLNTMEKNHGKIEKRLNSIQEDLLKLQQKMGQKDSVVLKEEAGGKRRVSATAKALGVTYSPIETFDHHFLMNMLWRETSVIKRVFVTLDVETAHPQLEVSDDRKRVRWTWTWKSLPDTAKRFTGCLCVLGSEGFTSGGHYWEVEVAGSRGWGLGVAAESVERKRRVALTPETGVWSIRQWGDGFDAFTSPPSRLPARPIPGRVGVYLSYESGAISFYDADTKSHLHTFTGNKFTEKLYPYFWTWDGNWLRICSGSAPGV